MLFQNSMTILFFLVQQTILKNVGNQIASVPISRIKNTSQWKNIWLPTFLEQREEE